MSSLTSIATVRSTVVRQVRHTGSEAGKHDSHADRADRMRNSKLTVQL